MSTKAKRGSVRGLKAVVLLVTATLLSWDISSTIAERLRGVGLYGLSEDTWVIMDREVPPELLDPIEPPAPTQNSVVGVCQSTDVELGFLAAPLTDTLSYEQVDSITRLAVQRAGGLDAVVDPGDWVVIKPNILNFHDSYIFGYPDTIVQGTATDLRVVKSLIQQLVEEGDASRITISEGGDWHNLNYLPPELQGVQTEDGWTVHWPYYGNLSYEGIVAEFDTLYPGITFDIVDMNYPPYTERPVPGGGLMADTYTIPDVLDCDVLIPVATMKTHFISRITCIHKHYVGVTPATVYRSGTAPFNMNHSLLPHGDNIEKVVIDLFSYHPADFSLVECFWGMEGYGPHRGIPIQRNVVLASTDPVALDAADAYVMGFNPWDIDHLHWSHNKGFGTYDLDYITVNGPALDAVRYEFIKAPRGPGYYLGRGNRIWLVNGPHDGSTDLDAEQLGVGVEAAISPVPGQMTQGNEWTIAQFSDVSEYCDLSAFYGSPSNCVSYAFTRIVADTAQTAYLRFGGDDGIKIRLNGSVVYNQAAVGGSGWSKVEDGVSVNLTAGVNRLLLKISNTSSGYGFSLITTESGTDGDTPLGMEYRVTATAAPEVVLHSPSDGTTSPNTYSDLVTSVTDGDGDPMTVRIYGGDTPAASDLLYLEESVPSGTQITYTWNAPVLQVTSDTRGLWHLNENSGPTVTDESGYGNTGAITGATWSTSGRFGPGLSFAGSPGDYLDVGNDPSLNPTNELTFEAWINVNQFTGNGPKVFIRDSCSAMRVRSDGGLSWELGRSGPYAEVYATTPPGSVPLREWVYVAGTCDTNGVMNAFVNGQLLGTNNLGGSLRSANTNLYVGWWPDYYMDGLMDEVRVSDRALTEAEIQASYELANGTYHWKVIASDGSNADTSETRSFTVGTASPDSQPPGITLNAPPNGAQFPESSFVGLDVTVSDPEFNPMEVWIYGDTSSVPATLLYHQSGLSSPADILYTWGGVASEFSVTANTVALWHFNENAGTTASDETGNHDGAVLNATWASGRFGSALRYDGGDRVEIPDSPDWNTPAFTIQAWVNAGTFSSTYNCVVTKGSYPSPVDLGYCLAAYNRRLVFLMGNADGSDWDVLLDAMGATALSTDTWYHVAVTYDGSYVRLYVNGVLDTNGAANPYFYDGGLHYAVGPVDIGSSLQQATADAWDGLIDEVRILNVALTAAQIQASFALDAGRHNWYVVATDSSGNDSTSPIRYFEIGLPIPPPGIPTLIDPPDLALINDSSPTFEWSFAAGPGGSYTLQYSLNAGFTTGLQTIAGITDTAYTVPGALADDTYYWHVQAFNSVGDSSGYQATPFSLTLDTQAPDVPTLVNPPDLALINDSSPTLEWSSTAGGGGIYTLQYALDSGFTVGVQTITALADTIYTVPGALSDDTYHWHVQAEDQAGNLSGYQGTPCSFTLDTQAPDVPTLVDPPDLALINDSSPTFEWSFAAGPGGTYTLQYATDAGFTTGLVSVTGLTDTSYTVVGALADATYYWHVQAIDQASNASGYQLAPSSFTMDTEAPDVPLLINPPDESVLSNNMPTFEWTATAGSGGTYTVEFASEPEFTFVWTVSGLADTTYEALTPFMDGDYYWHVKASDRAGNESGYQTGPFMFTVSTAPLAIPGLLTPPDSSFTCDTTPAFTWTSVVPVTMSEAGDRGDTRAAAAAPTAVTYTLQYAPDPAFSQATTVAGIADATYTVLETAPVSYGTCYWRVEAVDGGNHSGYSAHPFQFGEFLAGDQNRDGVTTSADIIRLVNYIFKGGAAPQPCPAAGDVNCDGVVTSADIIYLVNYVFKSGRPPCNVGDLIANGRWNCP